MGHALSGFRCCRATAANLQAKECAVGVYRLEGVKTFDRVVLLRPFGASGHILRTEGIFEFLHRKSRGADSAG